MLGRLSYTTAKRLRGRDDTAENRDEFIGMLWMLARRADRTTGSGFNAGFDFPVLWHSGMPWPIRWRFDRNMYTWRTD